MSYVISEDAVVYLGLVVVKNRTKPFGGWGVGMGSNQDTKVISLLSMLFSSQISITKSNQTSPYLVSSFNSLFFDSTCCARLFPYIPFCLPSLHLILAVS